MKKYLEPLTGIGAALALGRNGAKTVLIEKFGFLGGLNGFAGRD